MTNLCVKREDFMTQTDPSQLLQRVLIDLASLEKGANLMSKFDRQLDAVYGEQRVAIQWSSSDPSDIDSLRKRLESEVDRQHTRLSLDLRGVEGRAERIG